MNYLRLLVIFYVLVSPSAFAVNLPNADIQLPLTKQSAAEVIQQKYQGKLLSVNEENTGGNIIFLIKMLHDDGEMKVYSLDAATGHPPE